MLEVGSECNKGLFRLQEDALGANFRIADHPPRGALALQVVSEMAIYQQLRTEAAD
jgi:hypothetical protein